jgi:hypothetical protein
VQVAAKGSTEFGCFVSAGKIGPGKDDKSEAADVTASDVVQLTLARRYLDDSDPRTKWSAKRAAEGLKSEGSGASIAAPWRSESMRLRYSR